MFSRDGRFPLNLNDFGRMNAREFFNLLQKNASKGRLKRGHADGVRAGDEVGDDDVGRVLGDASAGSGV